jgi:hypothetical protein
MKNTEIQANFIISGEELEPNIVTEMLGIVPSELMYKSDVTNEFKSQFWNFQIDFEESLDMSIQIEKIYAEFMGKEELILDIKRKYNAIISLIINIEIRNKHAPAIIIEDNVAPFLSKIGGTVDVYIDILS